VSQQNHFDVIVMGAGMVGAALAGALARQSFRVALVDRHAPQLTWPDEGFDIRVSAITRASQQLFTSLGAWSEMQVGGFSPYREMHVWDAGGEGAIHFDSADIGETDLGHIIENRVILRALHRTLSGLEEVTSFWPATATSMRQDTDRVSLVLGDGQVLSGQLLVGADGGRSWVRREAGISVTGWDYDQSALVCWVKPQQDHRETAWQRFLPTGPLAFLPLRDGFCSIVWSTTPDHARQLELMAPERFALELQAAFENALGPIEQVGPRAIFPLRFFETQHYVQPRLALVGDAAHTIHPLAGQGVNLGLADVQALVSVLCEARGRRRDVGSQNVLRRYERWRRADNRSVLVAMDGFKRLFSNDQPVLTWMRDAGLNLVDRLPPVKNFIMRQALGSDAVTVMRYARRERKTG
jgi:2-octaprenylphenol hydroxylase